MNALIGSEPLTGAQKSARYDAKHREKRALAARERFKANPRAVYEANEKWVSANPLKRLLQVARQRAKKRGHEFNLTEADLLPAPTHCPILNVKLNYHASGFDPNAASIDRMDNSAGYISGNVAIISRRANLIKNDGTASEHRAIANWMEK